MNSRMWSRSMALMLVGKLRLIRKWKNLPKKAVYHSVVLGLFPSAWQERRNLWMRLPSCIWLFFILDSSKIRLTTLLRPIKNRPQMRPIPATLATFPKIQ